MSSANADAPVPGHDSLPDDPSGKPPEPLAAPPPRDLYALDVAEDDPPFTPINWLLIAIGVVLMVIGFYLLSRVDARATNWQSIWAPMLITGSYIVIFLGILIVRRPDGEGQQPGEGDGNDTGL